MPARPPRALSPVWQSARRALIAPRVLVGSKTSLCSIRHNELKVGKFHFDAPIGALVLRINCRKIVRLVIPINLFPFIALQLNYPNHYQLYQLGYLCL